MNEVVRKISGGTLCALLLAINSNALLASGNHPQAGACPKEKPYYAICTHSFHSLEGWFGSQCYSDKLAAQQEAEAHARSNHQGNMRWTGIKKTR